MLIQVPLDVLIIDPSQDSSATLKAELSKYRHEGREKYVGNLIAVKSIQAAEEAMKPCEFNCIFIDPIQIGLDDASQFIFRIRIEYPEIVFVLFNNSDDAEANAEAFYAGDRNRFRGYYMLNKKSIGDKFERKVYKAIHLCMSDIRLRVSLAKKAVAELRQRRLPPPAFEITESLAAFDNAYGNQKLAFIMMPFESRAMSPERRSCLEKIASAIRQSFERFGIMAVRADDRVFHENRYNNIRTYMYRCHYGVAVVEQMDGGPINANVAFEVGFMKAFNKPVCILKDKPVRFLQSDLLDVIYKGFDSSSAESSINEAINSWIGDQLLKLTPS